MTCKLLKLTLRNLAFRNNYIFRLSDERKKKKLFAQFNWKRLQNKLHFSKYVMFRDF